MQRASHRQYGVDTEGAVPNKVLRRQQPIEPQALTVKSLHNACFCMLPNGVPAPCTVRTELTMLSSAAGPIAIAPPAVLCGGVQYITHAV